jgi:predicted N-acyltransferase
MFMDCGVFVGSQGCVKTCAQHRPACGGYQPIRWAIAHNLQQEQLQRGTQHRLVQAYQTAQCRHAC